MAQFLHVPCDLCERLLFEHGGTRRPIARAGDAAVDSTGDGRAGIRLHAGMDMKKIGIIVAALSALAAAACKDALDVGSFSVTGAWRGTTYVKVGATDSIAYTFRLDLEQDRADVSGSGVISAGADSVQTSVDGTWEFPSVTLRLSSPEYADIRFDSEFAREVSRDSLVGPLTGSGFTGRTLTLVRQTP